MPNTSHNVLTLLPISSKSHLLKCPSLFKHFPKSPHIYLLNVSLKSKSVHSACLRTLTSLNNLTIISILYILFSLSSAAYRYICLQHLCIQYVGHVCALSSLPSPTSPYSTVIYFKTISNIFGQITKERRCAICAVWAGTEADC